MVKNVLFWFADKMCTHIPREWLNRISHTNKPVLNYSCNINFIIFCNTIRNACIMQMKHRTPKVRLIGSSLSSQLRRIHAQIKMKKCWWIDCRSRAQHLPFKRMILWNVRNTIHLFHRSPYVDIILANVVGPVLSLLVPKASAF